MKKIFSWIYMLSNRNNTVVYTGVTSDLPRRVFQHKSGEGGAFSRKYKTVKLVYYETFEDIKAAIQREKQLKGGPSRNKFKLINCANPEWKDLIDDID